MLWHSSIGISLLILYINRHSVSVMEDEGEDDEIDIIGGDVTTAPASRSISIPSAKHRGLYVNRSCASYSIHADVCVSICMVLRACLSMSGCRPVV